MQQKSQSARIPAQPARPAPRVPHHTLMRLIGRGRTGDVWLACDAEGVFRAVRVSYREQFDTEEAFGWELYDITSFEPLSLGDDGFLDILQTGENEAKDCVFCAMELADDVGGASLNGAGSGTLTPEAYQPRSVKNELDVRGAMPFDLCLRAATNLSRALAYAHAQGLLCPITKISDIFFVNGNAKAGVVGRRPDSANIGRGCSQPLPAHFGTKQGDIESLAMVIYQMATGKDSRQFPAWPHRPEVPKGLWHDFRQVLVHASEGRYPTADRLHADFEALQSGRRIGQTGLKIAVLATAVVLLAAGGTLLLVKRSSREQSPSAPQQAIAHQQQRQQVAAQAPSQARIQPPPSPQNTPAPTEPRAVLPPAVTVPESMKQFLALPSFSGKVLWADTFAADSSSKWRINKTSDDTAAEFGYDYRKMGIPPAPGSSSTIGLRLAANMSNPPGRESIDISPASLSLSGNYRLKFQVWMNANGPFPEGGVGSTQYIMAGVGTDGKRVHWRTATNTDDDGIWFAVNGDGDIGSGSDYYAFRGGHLCLSTEPGVYAAGSDVTSRDNKNQYYWKILSGGQTPPPQQQQQYPAVQTGSILEGSIGFGWHTFEIIKIDSTIAWRIDGLLIATLGTQPQELSGNIFLGYADCLPSVANEPELCFAVIANLDVEEIGAIPPK